MTRLGGDTTQSTSGHIRAALIAALLTSVALPVTARAATPDPAPDKVEADDIIVTGQRANIISALGRKRSADTVVDSITSDELGSFPDKSVADALQRVPGITVGRFNGTDDTSHFSAEPSLVLIRGLTQVRSEFNGRDTFSANSSRGLNYGDISPELLAGVDTYKNQTAELIEGGIAGTVDLRTRLPLDQKERLLSFNANMSYGSLSHQGTPSFSGIFADKFSTGIGTFGILFNIAYSQVKTASQSAQYDRIGIFDNVFGPGLQYIPTGVFLRENLYDRKRLGISAAAQWESNDGHIRATAQFNRSSYDNSWREHSIDSSAFDVYALQTDYKITDPGVVRPQTGTPAFTFDSQGNFLKGSWSQSSAGYFGETPNSGAVYAANSSGQEFFQKCYSWEGCTARRAPNLDVASNALRNKEYTQDADFSLKWDVTERLGLKVDAQYVTSEVHNYNGSVNERTYINTFVDLSGKYPSLTFDPLKAEGINLSPGGLSNPNNYAYRSASDHTEDSKGSEFALRADADYDLDSDWFDALRIGARYADRDQTVRWGAYNWQNIANTWSANAAYYNIDKPVYPAGNYGNGGFTSGSFPAGQTNVNNFVFFDLDKLSTRAGLAGALGAPTTGVGDFNPVCSNAGARAGEVEKGEFGCYLPGEIYRFNERTWAGYAMLKFGGPDARIGGIGISGNIGARLVWTHDATRGSFTFANPFTAAALVCTPPPVGGPRPGGALTDAGCVTSADEIKFNNGASLPNRTSARHFNVLPSFNLKLDLTSRLVSRFAFSRAMSRPDVGLLRSFINVNRLSPNLTDRNNPAIIFGPDGVTPVGYNFGYNAQAGNPNLKPIVADQFDATLEYYFAKDGTLSATLFQKNFQNYIQQGRYVLAATNNGVTRNILVTGPQNGDGAKIRGAEFNFTTYFHFLPGALKGLGVQANYTYVQNQGIKSGGLISSFTGGADPGAAGGGVTFDSTAVKADALEGISPHSFNIIGMYESEMLSIRAAYNWRSKYLVSAIDCCIGLPLWQKSQGFLDATIRFRPMKQFEISLEGSNLLGTDTVLYQQVNNAGLLKLSQWSKQDRRFQVGVRLTY